MIVKYLMHLNPRLAAVYDNRSPFDEKRFLIDADPSRDLQGAPLPSGEPLASLVQRAVPSWSAALLLPRQPCVSNCHAPSVLGSCSGPRHPLPSEPLLFAYRAHSLAVNSVILQFSCLSLRSYLHCPSLRNLV